jgi:hypothetical protein
MVTVVKDPAAMIFGHARHRHAKSTLMQQLKY